MVLHQQRCYAQSDVACSGYCNLNVVKVIHIILCFCINIVQLPNKNMFKKSILSHYNFSLFSLQDSIISCNFSFDVTPEGDRFSNLKFNFFIIKSY